ncbi:hypothetical protein [Streptomyces flavofungini]|uniref:hypothetical protein n=1 Tax=Streptomyces flavofungini TaxID=68200 RepID=UPI001986EF0E|nr:hypothetical protein [Streptomyces flavofungini]GHC68560.1 hypothetical protein GCM10010349_42760 [Streptomyces flavofungini]
MSAIVGTGRRARPAISQPSATDTADIRASAIPDCVSSCRPVELGLFANGMVEVSGDGITEGLKVAVPK